MLARVALGSIWLYQNYVSPRKGFRCAYAVKYGGTGCSGYAKAAIRAHGPLAAVPLVRRRFQDCKSAHISLRSSASDEDNSKKPKGDSCTKRLREGCIDGAINESCNSGSSCFGKVVTKSTKNCDADIDFCNCG